jgi:hypothetical protein
MTWHVSLFFYGRARHEHLRATGVNSFMPLGLLLLQVQYVAFGRMDFELQSIYATHFLYQYASPLAMLKSDLFYKEGLYIFTQHSSED